MSHFHHENVQALIDVHVQALIGVHVQALIDVHVRALIGGPDSNTFAFFFLIFQSNPFLGLNCFSSSFVNRQFARYSFSNPVRLVRHFESAGIKLERFCPLKFNS